MSGPDQPVARSAAWPDERGLTFIEIIVTVVIVAVLAVAIYPMLGNVLDAVSSKGASEQVASAVRLARQFAITTGENRCIAFQAVGSPPKYQYRIETADGSGCTGTVISGYDWTDVSHKESVVTTATSLVFNPVGNRIIPSGGGSSIFAVYLNATPITCINTITVTQYGGVRVQQASC